MRKKWILLISVIGLFILGFIGINLYNQQIKNDLESADNNLKTSEGSLMDQLNQNNEDLIQEVVDNRKTVIFGLYGTDEREDDVVSRGDIIMVVKYDPQKKHAVIASIPRDTRVEIPGYGLDKINHSYAFGGQELLDQSVENLLGIKLDFSIKTDFDTFSRIIDDLGGVEVVAAKDFYRDVSGNEPYIKQGEQILDSEHALFYVRFRHDEDGDFGRISRQQEVIVSLVQRLSETSLEEIDELIKKYYNNGMETSASLLKIQEYLNLGTRDTDVTFDTYQLDTGGVLIDDIWYEVYNQEDLDAIKALFADPNLNQDNWE